jgi:hypothetical protein
MTDVQRTLLTPSMALDVGTRRFLPPGRSHVNVLDTSECRVTIVLGVHQISVVVPLPRKLYRAAHLVAI